MPKASKTKSSDQNALTSTMLVLNPQDDQLAALIEYLTKKQLIQASLKQARSGSLHNLHLYNQNQEGLKIKTVREILEASSFGSYNSQLRIIAILHAQQSSIPAQNALLKIVEEPPANSLVVLTTAYPKQLLPTIHSRCLRAVLEQPPSKEVDQKAANPTSKTGQSFSQEIIKAAKQILSSSFNQAQAIELAAKHKKREQALKLTEDLINHLHQQLNQNQFDRKLNSSNKQLSNSKIRHTIEQLLGAYQDLLKNLNPSLTLEHYLFNVASF